MQGALTLQIQGSYGLFETKGLLPLGHGHEVDW
jgi:hypothetical protein